MSFLFGLWCGAMLMGGFCFAVVWRITRSPLPEIETERKQVKQLERMVGL